MAVKDYKTEPLFIFRFLLHHILFPEFVTIVKELVALSYSVSHGNFWTKQVAIHHWTVVTSKSVVPLII